MLWLLSIPLKKYTLHKMSLFFIVIFKFRWLQITQNKLAIFVRVNMHYTSNHTMFIRHCTLVVTSLNWKLVLCLHHGICAAHFSMLHNQLNAKDTDIISLPNCWWNICHIDHPKEETFEKVLLYMLATLCKKKDPQGLENDSKVGGLSLYG